MVRNDKVCLYLDMPLQHASTKMLKGMKRGITREKTDQLIKDIRAKVPGIALRTTLIAGHPGEGEEEYQEMVDFVIRNRFDRLGIFTYSHEDNTHAGSMDDSIPEEVKELDGHKK